MISVLEWVDKYLDIMSDPASLKIMRAKAAIDALGKQEVIDALTAESGWVLVFAKDRDELIEAYAKIEARMEKLGLDLRDHDRRLTHEELKRFETIRRTLAGNG